MRALAGGQLLTFGWREGMPVEEAKIYVDEALGYAREAGNRRHEAMLIGGYGRIIAANGSADEYIRLVREALAVLDAEANPEEALLLNGLLCQANMLAGFLGDALSANSAALDLIDDETPRQRRHRAWPDGSAKWLASISLLAEMPSGQAVGHAGAIFGRG